MKSSDYFITISHITPSIKTLNKFAILGLEQITCIFNYCQRINCINATQVMLSCCKRLLVEIKTYEAENYYEGALCSNYLFF